MSIKSEVPAPVPARDAIADGAHFNDAVHRAQQRYTDLRVGRATTVLIADAAAAARLQARRGAPATNKNKGRVRILQERVEINDMVYERKLIIPLESKRQRLMRKLNAKPLRPSTAIG